MLSVWCPRTGAFYSRREFAMQNLRNLIADSEDWLTNRVLGYARGHRYTDYTSTLVEAWRASISGLSAPLLASLDGGMAMAHPGRGRTFSSTP